MDTVKLKEGQAALLQSLVRKNDTEAAKTLEMLIDELDISGKRPKTSASARIRGLRKALEPTGISIHESGDKYWVNYRDLQRAGMEALVKTERTQPGVFLYMSTKGPMGTTLFEPEVAEGLRLYLDENVPTIAGRTVEGGSLTDRLDAVFIMGGLLPEIPMKTGVKSQRGGTIRRTLGLMGNLMSGPQAEAEDRRLETLLKSEAPETVIYGHRGRVYSMINSIDDAATVSASHLQQMLGVDCPVFYHPGEEDHRNRTYMAAVIKDQIGSKRGMFKRITKSIEQTLEREQELWFRRGLRMHFEDEIQKMYDYILGDSPEAEARLLRTYNSEYEPDDKNYVASLSDIRNAMIHQPTRERNRSTFQILHDEHLKAERVRLEQGGINWNPEYFGDLDPKVVEKVMTEQGEELGRDIVSDMIKMVTFKGLRWKLLSAQSTVEKTRAHVREQQRKRRDLEPKIDEYQAGLYALGWLDDKDLKDAGMRDMAVVDLFVDDWMNRVYDRIAGDDLDLRILSSGESALTVGGVDFQVMYDSSSSHPLNGPTKAAKKRIQSLASQGDYVPDVFLTGPSSKGFGVSFERKRGLDTLHGPERLRYERMPETAAIVEVGSMFTHASIDDYVKHASKNTAGYPDGETAPGQIVIHVVDETGAQQFHVVSVEDLKGLVTTNPASFEYTPTQHVVNFHDTHFGEAEPWYMTSSEQYADAVALHLMNRVLPNLEGTVRMASTEFFDGTQVMRGRHGGLMNYALTEEQLDAAEAAIDDSSYSTPYRRELRRELRLMIERSHHVSDTGKQGIRLKKSRVWNLMEDITGRGGWIFYASGDHTNRTMRGNMSEASFLRSMALGVPAGRGEYPGRTIDQALYIYEDDISITGRFRGELPDGSPLYVTHKMKPDAIGHLEVGMIDARATFIGHRHHGLFAHWGGRILAMSPGTAAVYGYVEDIGAAPSLPGAQLVSFAENTGPYSNSASMYFAGGETLMHHPDVRHKSDLRRILVDEMIPAHPDGVQN